MTGPGDHQGGHGARFHVGQLVNHLKFGYRGVIFDADADFQESEEWYQTMATSRPPRDRPWYRVLVHGATHTTYVAERNLEPDDDDSPIDHPLVDVLFTGFENGQYRLQQSYN